MRRQVSAVATMMMLVVLAATLAPGMARAIDATATAETTPPPAPLPAAPATSSATELTATPPAETTPTPRPVIRVEDDNPWVWFSGSWRYAYNSNTSGASSRYARKAGSTARMGFDGTRITWITRVGPNMGRARVYVDGVAKATVDLYAPIHGTKRPVWTSGALGHGRHTLRIEVLGSRAAPSTGTWVYVDAFDIDGTQTSLGTMPGTRVQNGDKRLYRKGAWRTARREGTYGGTIADTWSRGASTSIRFKGTAVTWYGKKDPKGGKAEVWLDGKRVAVISQYSTARADRRVIWAIGGLPDRTHDLRIRALSAPSAPDGGRRTDIDAFQVRGRVQQAPRPTPFHYPWKTYIVIDKSQFRLYWVKNGWLIRWYPIAHGKVSTPTPSRVWRIDAKYKPDPRGVYGPRKMRLFKRVSTGRGYVYVYTAYGIHGTNQPWVIGTRASHGCIRMYNADVLELWPQVPLGTMVVTRD